MTRISQSDLARDALYTKVNQIADEQVSLEGDQTIDGQKTFTQNVSLTNNSESYRHIYSNNSAVTKGTIPSANTGTDFVFRDSQNSIVGRFSAWYNTGGVIRAGFCAYAPTAKSNGYGELVMDSTETGSQLSFVTYNGLNNTNLWGASSDTSRNLVALQGWVNNPSMSTNVVHRSGNETISGTKTFTTHPVVQSTTEYSSIGYRVQNTQITRGTAPTTGNASGEWVFQDSGGLGVNNRIGGMEVTYLTDGSIRTSLQVFKPTASTTQNPYTYSTLALIYPASGNPYTYCIAPTDTTSTNGTQIATTGWVNGTSHNLVHKSGNETIAGTKTFSTTPVVGTKGNSDSTTSAASTAFVHNILAALYPVGSIYIGTQSTCPLATLIPNSTWSKIAGDKVLQSSSSSHAANTTISAGLPNITGRYNHQCLMNNNGGTEVGALYTENNGGDTAAQYAGGSSGSNTQTIAFDASKSNSTYGKSTTVQPPAYVVNVWRRTK